MRTSIVGTTVKWGAALALMVLPFLPFLSRQSRSIAFVGINVLPMDRDVVLAGQTVLVDNGRIVAVGDTGEVRIPRGARRIEGGGRFLMPGLSDMHVHLIGPEHHEGIALLLAAHGVTTVRNMWGYPEVLPFRERVESGELIGPRIFTSGPITDGEPPVWPGSRVVRTAAEAAAAVRADRRAGYDAIKVYSNLTRPAYLALTAAARQQRMPVWGHVPDAIQLEEAFAAGQSSVEHLQGYALALQPDGSPFGAARSGPVDDTRAVAFVDDSGTRAIVEATRVAGVWNVPTLVVNENIVGEEEGARRQARAATRYVAPTIQASWDTIRVRWLRDFTEGDFARYREVDAFMARMTGALHDGGAGILVGTDAPNPYVVPGVSVHEELANLVAAGLSPYQALRAATIDAARFLGREAEFGSIAPGQRADLLLLEADPRLDVANASRRAGVMLNGRWHPQAELQQRVERLASEYQAQELLVAAFTGDSVRVASQVAAGADPEAADSTGLTPLMAAAYAGRPGAVRALVAGRADLESTNARGQTALIMAAYAGRGAAVEALIAAGAMLNAPDATGLTPLMAAAYAGHVGIVRTLLATGADPALRNQRGQTALDLARYSKHDEVVRVLEQAAPPP